jgi:alkylhydroperoxidase family enzyme
MESEMDPMYLPEVEAAFPEGEMGEALRKMRDEGKPYPQIFHLFAYKPERTAHLMRYAEAVMGGSSPLSPGIRELIAAMTSKVNDCHF